MLDCLGVPWVTAAGEAEAMCAYLDSQGLVDGCITNDGDAFLYGAQTVYRNFNMNTKVTPHNPIGRSNQALWRLLKVSDAYVDQSHAFEVFIVHYEAFCEYLIVAREIATMTL